MIHPENRSAWLKKIISNSTHAQTNLLKTTFVFTQLVIMLYKKFHLFHHQHGPDFSRCRFVACTCFSCPPFFSPPSILHRINFVFRIILFSVDPHQHPGAQDMIFQSLILAFRSLHSYVLTYTSNCIFFNLAKVKQSLPDPLWAAL